MSVDTLRALAAGLCICLLVLTAVWTVHKGWLNYEWFGLTVAIGATVLLFVCYKIQ